MTEVTQLICRKDETLVKIDLKLAQQMSVSEENQRYSVFSMKPSLSLSLARDTYRRVIAFLSLSVLCLCRTEQYTA